MKKYVAPLTLGLSCIAYGLVVLCAFYFVAQAQGATNVCNIDCLMQKMDALNQKAEALEHTMDGLTTQVGKSINRTDSNPAHASGAWRRMPHLHWSERRSGWFRFLECKLFQRHLVDDQLASPHPRYPQISPVRNCQSFARSRHTFGASINSA